MLGGRSMMSTLSNPQDLLSSIRSKISLNAILLLVFVLVLIGLSIYYYYTYIAPKLSTKYSANSQPNYNNTSSGQPELILFYVDWCPHCKTAKPEWDKVKQEYTGQSINGSPILFKEVNCTDETSEVQQMIAQYKIEGYPTIKLLKDGKVIEFDSKPTQDSLKQFLNTVM
jgi:thiol-disulfide isomerase/thioredoxin